MLLSRGLGSADVALCRIQGMDPRWAAVSCAGCHKDLGAGVQIWFVSTSSCDSCVLLDFFTSFCCEESRSTLISSMPIPSPGTHMERSVPVAPWRLGAVSTLWGQAPTAGWEAASSPMAAPTSAHREVRPLLTWRLSEALFLLGKTLSSCPSTGRVGRGPSPHPVSLPRATCPMPKGLAAEWGKAERQPRCEQEEREGSRDIPPHREQGLASPCPQHELPHLPLGSPQHSSHVAKKLVEG